MGLSQSMNLLIAINKKYLAVCETMLYSFFYTHSEQDIHVYVLNKTLENSDIEELSQFIGKLGGRAIIIPIQDTLLESLPIIPGRFSIEMYFRIFAYKFLPPGLDRILWLDADIVLLGNMNQFYYQEFDGKSLIVCRDLGYRSNGIREIKKKLDVNEKHAYFNSGVILFNLEVIRAQFREEEFRKVALKYADKLVYPDQDLLNHVYQNKVKYGDEMIYNYQVNNTFYVNAKKSGTRVLHYTGSRKPWDVKRAYPIARYYWKYQLKLKRYKQYCLFYFFYSILYVPKIIKRMVSREE